MRRTARVGTTAHPDDAGDAPGVGAHLATSSFMETCERRDPRSRWKFPFDRGRKPLDSTHAIWLGAGIAAQEWGGLSVLFLMLAVTAVAIAYAGEARIGTAASLLHLIFAAASTVLFSWHWWQGVRLKRPPSRSHPAGPGV